MFGSFFFPNKVANRLFKMGWTPESLPMEKAMLSQLSDALKANGYDADRAATLLDKVFRDNPAARKELRDNTGLFGISLIDDDGHWRW